MEAIKKENTFLALIPAYEPEEVLAGIVEDLNKNGLEVIVVDDGSGEAFAPLFSEIGKSTIVLHHEKNQGKGSAVKTGLQYIAEHYPGPYTVVCVDADGQHKTGDVLKVVQQAYDHPDSLVLGSRKFCGNVPLKSRIGNTVTRRIFRLLCGTGVYDTQTGLRAFSGSLIPVLLGIGGQRYEYEMNVLMQFAKEKRPIREVWIETVYVDNNACSHFRAVKDSARIYGEILKFTAASLTGFLTDYAIYCLLLSVTGRLLMANVTARIFSASLNYTLNRNLVFAHDGSVIWSALQYGFLAVGILMGNTMLLGILAQIGWNRYLAKILVEIFFFFISWTFQKQVVFGGKDRKL